MTPRSHRLADHLTVAVFAAAPFSLGLSGAAAVVSYVLATIHLLLTVTTRFPVHSAGRRPVSLSAHGAIEVLVGIMLLLVPWVVPVFSVTARAFLAVMGALIVVVWKLTPYEAADEVAVAGSSPDGRRDAEPPPRP